MIINLTEDLWNNIDTKDGRTIELFGYIIGAYVKAKGVKFFEIYEPGELRQEYKRMSLGEYIMFQYNY